MRRPEVRFWRAIFVASVVLFAAGVAVAAATLATGGAFHTSGTASFVYGAGLLGVAGSSNTIERNLYATLWTRLMTAPALNVIDRRLYLLRGLPSGPTGFLALLPAYYIPALALITGVPSAVILHRHKKRNAAGLCAGCGYSLSGLPVDAAACPECGGKIQKSTS
jgi:hypothetical protein